MGWSSDRPRDKMEAKKQEVSLVERTFIVTGATDGIGLAVVRELIGSGHAVIGVARNREKAANVAAAIGSERLSFVFADLSSVAAVREAGEAIKRVMEENRAVPGGIIHVAGTVSTHRETSVDGYEKTFAVNHLAVHHLTGILLPLFGRTAGARVLVVTSRAHKWGFVHFRDVSWKHGYWLLTAYAQSKLMNVLFVRDMARRTDPAAVSFYAIDPGLVDTGIVAKTSAGIERWIWSWRRHAGDSPEVSARHIARIATGPEYAMRSGFLWRDGEPKKPGGRSGNVRTMERLRLLSDALVEQALLRAESGRKH